MAHAQILIEQWREHYNTVRLHSSHDNKPPAPEETSVNSRLVQKMGQSDTSTIAIVEGMDYSA